MFTGMGTGEMAQLLGARAVPTEDSGSVPSRGMAGICNFPSDLQGLLHTCGTYT